MTTFHLIYRQIEFRMILVCLQRNETYFGTPESQHKIVLFHLKRIILLPLKKQLLNIGNH